MTIVQRVINQLRWYKRRLRSYIGEFLEGRARGESAASTVNELLEQRRARRPATNYDIWTRHRIKYRRTHAPAHPPGPSIAVIVPVFRPDIVELRQCLDSVIGQSYENWELIAVDDGSDDDEVAKVLQEYAVLDGRVVVHSLAENVGIGLATQHGVDHANSEYVCFLDNDDTLTPDALLLAASQLARDPTIDFLYADEDKQFDSGKYGEPSFRPEKNHDLLLSYNFVSHPTAVRRDRIAAIGGVRPGFDGSQDHDLALRLQDDGAVFRHLPEVIYHWRVSKGSAAGSAHAKPYAYEAGLKAVSDSVNRQGLSASVRRGLVPGHYELLFKPPVQCRVGIVVATNAPAGPLLDRLRYLIDPPEGGIETEVILVRTPVSPKSQRDLSKWPKRWSDVRGFCVRYQGWPDQAAALNLGVSHLDSVDFLVFVDDDVVVVEPATLGQLLGNASRGGVGAVGVVELDAESAIISSGIEVEAGVARASHAKESWGSAGHHDLARRMREVSAVSASLMVTSSDTFQTVGNFSRRFPHKYFDVAYCLEFRSKLGLRAVIDPIHPVLREQGRQRLAAGATDQEEIAFAAFANQKTPRKDPFIGHDNPAAIPPYQQLDDDSH